MFDVSDSIRLFVRQRGELFYQERAIRWFQFKTWMYCSDDAWFVENAGLLAATRVLSFISPRVVVGQARKDHSAAQLSRLLRRKRYAGLYDGLVAESGGWTQLQRLHGTNFGDTLSQRGKDSDIVADMVDYQFRYLDHGGSDNTLANNSHARVYVHAHRTPSIGGKASKKAWVRHQRSSIFLYVNRIARFRLLPSPDEMDYEAAFTTDEVKDFLQQCAYVAKTLQERHPEFWNQSMMLEPIEGQMRPRTQPLLEREEDLKHDYGAKNLAMRGS